MRRSAFILYCYLILLLTGLVIRPTLAADLVYVPVEPCRLLDTRSTIGSIPADGTESFLAYGNAGELDSQGGNAAGCPNPKPGSTPVSIAANVTAVGNAASGNGNLVAYAYGSTVPSSSLVNYKVGTNIANSTIIALCEGDTCTYDFNLQSNFSSVPAIVDVQGYFYPKTMKNVITVSAENADFTSPIDAIKSIPISGPNAPSATNPYLIEIGPGTYDLGSTPLEMKEWVDIKGTGSREATVLTGAVSTTNAATSNLVVMANNVELTDLTIINTGGSAASIAILTNGTFGPMSPKIRRVKVRATGGSFNAGIMNIWSAAPSISNVNVAASGGTDNRGIYNISASPRIKEVTVEVSGTTDNYAFYSIGSSATSMIKVVARASGGSSQNQGVILFDNSSADIQFSTLEGGTGGFGLWTASTSSAKVSSSTLIGGAGGTTANNSCIYVADGDNNPLDTNCLPIP